MRGLGKLKLPLVKPQKKRARERTCTGLCGLPPLPRSRVGRSHSIWAESGTPGGISGSQSASSVDPTLGRPLPEWPHPWSWHRGHTVVGPRLWGWHDVFKDHLSQNLKLGISHQDPDFYIFSEIERIWEQRVSDPAWQLERRGGFLP